jgi:hypothetical protein
MRRFGNKAPSKKAHRAALVALLIRRDKPLDEAALISLSRSYGATVSEIERLWAEVKAA